MNKDALVNDPKSIDVTSPEKQYQIQCANVLLLSSHINTIEINDEENKLSRFIFKINGRVEENIAYAYLDVDVIYINQESEQMATAFELSFIMMGVFYSQEDIPPDDFADFIRRYSLSIVWPYAREYTSDQLRRCGQIFPTLPIINPRMVTEQLIKGGLVDVEISSKETSDQK